ncbi:Pentatricopeptide repeat-containing protein, mitochondrial [Glycine soja]|uniref:Pentatricopeptide repeat-containing protein, mitochondrial n=1 Tax=Glycine soja TaxID=3848 RepID=A0A445FVR8_GLYSO|nr:Pentatricopeptide repeat-containing protein, mitochondrial [Glycine soja]
MVPRILLKSQHMNIHVEESTFRVLIRALFRIKKVGYAVKMLNCMIEDGCGLDEKICSLIISALCEQKDLTSVEALVVWRDMRKLGFCPGVMDYTNMIRFLVKEGRGMDSFHILNQQKQDGINPDIVSYTMVLSGIVAEGEYVMLGELFDEMLVIGLIPDVYTYNVYINGLCKQNKVDKALQIVASMEELECKPNVVTYNTILGALCVAGDLVKARGLMKEMGWKGVGHNLHTYRIVLDGLVGIGEIGEACLLLEEMLKKCLFPRSSTFDDIILHLCAKRTCFTEAMELTKKMVAKSFVPGSSTWEALLFNSGCKVGQIHDFKTSSQEAVGPMQLELDDIRASLDGSRWPLGREKQLPPDLGNHMTRPYLFLRLLGSVTSRTFTPGTSFWRGTSLYLSWKDKSLRQVRVRGKLIKFDAETLNILGDPGGFGAKGEVLRLLQVLPFTPRPSGARRQIVYSRARARLVYGLVMKMDMDLDSIISGEISQMAQSNSSWLGFPALITTLCIARGVVPNSLTFESLSSAINLAYILKNYWNLDDPTIIFLGTHKTWARGPDAFSSAPPAPALAPPTPTPAPPAHSGTSAQSTKIFSADVVESSPWLMPGLRWPDQESSLLLWGGGEAPTAQEPHPEPEASPKATMKETPEVTPTASPLVEATEEEDGATDTNYATDMEVA